MTDTLEQHSEDVLLALINTTPALQSLLYDIDMMPEQLTEGSRNWTLMLAFAWAYLDGVAARNDKQPK